MPANPVRTLGPGAATAAGTTLAYTLQAGEHVDVGDLLICAFGGAGTGGAHVTSATDSKGNTTYQVDAFENMSGSAVATVMSMSPTTPLVAGDTITFTFAASNSDRVFFGRIVQGLSGLSGRVDLTGTAGATGTGSTAPSVRSGVHDGVGTPTPTSQPDDYIFVVTVWNGTATITEDTALSSIYSGHFDNAGAGLSKQIAVSERVSTAVGIKGYDDTLNHTQPWAKIVVCYKTTATAPTGLFGPHQETGAGSTCTYTLKSGESINVGETPIIHFGAAGAGGGTASGATDSAGNSYTVDQTDQPSGVAAASIISGRITTALHAGDTITVTTVGSTTTNRNMLIRVIDGLLGLGRVDQTSSSGSVGATTLELKTGIHDGAGSAQPTTQAQEYAAHLVVWNGSATLTLDGAMTEVSRGHFDYPTLTQVKQMSVAEANLSSTGVKTYDSTISASQGYAACLVTYKVDTGTVTPPTSKAAPRGLAGRDISVPPNGYKNSFHHMQFRIYWDIAQPTQSDGVTPVNENAVVASELTRVGGILDTLAATTRSDGVTYTGGIRFFAGYRSPAWLAHRVGTFRYRDPASSSNQVVNVPKFWLQQYLDAWDKVIGIMANHWDTHPAMRMFQIANAMTFFAEELIRHTSAPANQAEMVGGGYGWDPPPATTRSNTRLLTPSTAAGYSDSANMAALKHGIDAHASAWPNTPASISLNPYDVVLSQAEAQVTNPGIVYGSPLDNQIVSSDDSNLTKTKQVIDYMIAVLGPTDRCILENNSINSQFFLTGGALNTTTKMGKMYDYMRTRGVPLYYQCANTQTIGDFNKTMQGAVSQLKANAVEPSTNQGASPYTAAEFATWDAALYANPLPVFSSGGGGSGGQAHAPLNTADPVITIHSGTGYTPGTTLRTTMGTWDGGTHGVAHYVVEWWRIDPTTFAQVSRVRGPTTYTLGTATDDYTVVSGDDNFQIQSFVTPDNSDGTGLTDASNLTPKILATAAGAPANLILPTITPSNPAPGQVLLGNPGQWSNNPISFTYLFEMSMDGGATVTTVQGTSPDNTYQTLSDATQDGALFRVTVVANNGTQSAPAVSAWTSPLTGLPPLASPFGGPVNMPGWAYGESMPAWIAVDGTEVANWARTYEYLNAGLAGGSADAGMNCTCQMLYDPGGTGTPQVFQDPVMDNAPWNDPQRSESIQFLGMIVRNVTVTPQRTRTAVTVPGRIGGSVLTPSQSGGVVVTVSATLVAASMSGADYGVEWLRGVLGDPDCDVCGTSTVEVRTSCPPDDGSDPELGYWIIYRAGLTADVAVGAQDTLGNFTDVTWTWTSAEPSLFKPATNAYPDTILDPSDTVGAPCIAFDDWLCGPGVLLNCRTIVPPNKGAWGTIITITSPDGVGSIQLDMYSKCPPDIGTDPPDSSLLVTGVHGTLVIDSSQHSVTYINPDGVVSDGLDHLFVPAGQPLVWMEVLDCDPAKCICVSTPHPCSGGGQTTVRMDVQYRRRG